MHGKYLVESPCGSGGQLEGGELPPQMAECRTCSGGGSCVRGRRAVITTFFVNVVNPMWHNKRCDYFRGALRSPRALQAAVGQKKPCRHGGALIL
jgi:hypothetical protein